MSEISNVQNEVLFVGSFYKNPDLYVEHGRFVKSQYDLSDEVSKFLYDNFELYYKTFSQTIDETKVNNFMSQDNERFKTYRRYGGYKTIKSCIDLADIDDFDKYMEVVKKYSLLREFNEKGFDVTKIMEHKRFNTMKANDVYRIIRSITDKVGTVIMSNETAISSSDGMLEAMVNWVNKPSIGILTPFDTLNELFRGLRKGKMLCNGMLSNGGKSRFMILLSAYISLVKGEKTLILANEMGEEDYRACLLVTVLNNVWFQSLHGINIQKCEKEIVLGMYRDRNGEFIKRLEDENGEFIESETDYIKRLYRDSDEFVKVQKVAEWIESQTKNKIFFKQLFDYNDDVLDIEIRKYKIVHGVDYVFYDTLKPSKVEDWGLFKQTVTKLNSLAVEVDVFIYGSIQLTDDVEFTEIFSLSSNNIANAKQIKHVLDYLTLTKHIKKDEYHKYQILLNDSEEWGKGTVVDLDLSKRYCASKIDKNRSGDKSVIPVYEIDLDLNVWIEKGHLLSVKK